VTEQVIPTEDSYASRKNGLGTRFSRRLKRDMPPEWVRILDLVFMLVRRELKVKYRGSFLGYIWSMLNPLLFMLVISVVFSFLVKGIPNYPLFVLSGILFWNLTSNSIAVGALSIISGAPLIRKVKMPIWIFPVVPVLTFASNMVFALVPYILIFIFAGPGRVPELWLFPVVLVLFLLFLIGISLVVATLNVFFRDIGHVIEPVLVLLMYGTPIIYDRTNPALPPKVRMLLGLNPFTHFVEAGRKTIFGGGHVTLEEMAILVLCSAVSLATGCLIYKRRKSKIIFAL